MEAISYLEKKASTALDRRINQLANSPDRNEKLKTIDLMEKAYGDRMSPELKEKFNNITKAIVNGTDSNAVSDDYTRKKINDLNVLLKKETKNVRITKENPPVGMLHKVKNTINKINPFGNKVKTKYTNLKNGKMFNVEQRKMDIKARQEAEERAKQEAAERARQEAAERAKKEAEERARQEAAERAKQEAAKNTQSEVENTKQEEIKNPVPENKETPKVENNFFKTHKNKLLAGAGALGALGLGYGIYRSSQNSSTPYDEGNKNNQRYYQQGY